MTWWGQRWQALFGDPGPSAARQVQRGLALARRGAVDDLTIEPGRVTATVTEDRSHPTRVELAWPVASPEAWDGAIARLTGALRFTAALLEGELPEELAEALAAAGVRLLPEPGEVAVGCSVDEVAQPCRHAIAVHAAAGTLVERDPTLLLVLRGRSRDDLLRTVRADRGGDAPVATDLPDDLDAARGDLDAVALHPAPVEDPAGLFRHLGDPPGVDDVRPIVAAIERAAAGAWRLAAGAGPAAADRELLLTELRARRVASAEALAVALGRDVEEVQAELDELFEDGAVLRTGAGNRVRYRAP